jgi:hypothetical protein
LQEQKRRNIGKLKLINWKLNSKIKNLKHLYMGIIEFKKGYQPGANTVKDEKGDLVKDWHSILLGGGTISLSCSMYVELMMLGRQKFIQQSH